MKSQYLIALGVVVLLAGGVYWWTYAGAPPGPADLATRALSGGTAEDRAKAAAELATIQEGSLPHLRRVAKESSDPAVLIVAFTGLSLATDQGSVELFLAGMGNQDQAVREAAYRGLAKVMSIPAEKLDEFKASDPEASRTEAIGRLKMQYVPDPSTRP